MKTLVEYAKSFIGVPYIFGGEHPCLGLDCSAVVQHVLKSVGADPPGDQTAQLLFNHYLVEGSVCKPQAGALTFYGKSVNAITHIAFMIDEHRIVEAGGGDASTTDIQKSIDRGAFVRIRPYDHRKDLVGILMPKYAEWVKND